MRGREPLPPPGAVKFKGNNSASGVGRLFDLFGIPFQINSGRHRSHRDDTWRRDRCECCFIEVRGDRGRRQHRQDAVFGERRRAALSRLADQDDDALPSVRGAQLGQAVDVEPGALLRAGCGRGADQARREGRKFGDGRDRDLFAGDPLGQRFRDRAGRIDRRIASELRPHDDGQGASPRHERHHLPERPRPARRRAEDDGARHVGARHRTARALSAILQGVSRPAPSPTARPASPTTIACSAVSTASTGSRRAIPAHPVSTSCPRYRTAIGVSSPS